MQRTILSALTGVYGGSLKHRQTSVILHPLFNPKEECYAADFYGRAPPCPHMGSYTMDVKDVVHRQNAAGIG